ncbi:MAG: PDZ domain-containing protein [Magnetococcales bacterium]|nr:PDZ domain-containing protein [Magnetococcales bacterium]
MSRLPQFILAAALLGLLGIILVALFVGPYHGQSGGAATAVPPIPSVSPVAPVGLAAGQPQAVPAAMAVAPQTAEAAQAVVQGGRPSGRKRVAGARAAPPDAYIPPNLQWAEAHWQGMEGIPLTEELKKKLKLPMDLQGVLLDETTLAAAASGLRAGDVLVAINGNTVTTLEGVLRESKRVKRQKSVPLTVWRRGRLYTVVLAVPDELGFAQVETAPMILSGDIAPHPYRGPCTQCHAVGTGGHMVPDPDLVTLPAPVIRADTPRPHQDRGACEACHIIVP